MWNVLAERIEDHRHVYDVQCSECGATKVVRRTRPYIESKCRNCNVIHRNTALRGQHHGVGQLTRTFFNYFQNVARRRGIVFDLTPEYLWELALEQDMKCALTGLDLVFPTSTFRGNHIATNCSLDRICSTLGYAQGNVQWVHKSANIMKNSLPQDEFVYLCHRVAACHANPQPSVLKGVRLGRVSTKVQRLGSEGPNPITSPRAPDTAESRDEIVRHSGETRRGED